MKVSEVIKQLETCYLPDEEIAYDIWSAEDIIDLCNDYHNGIKLTDKEIENILIEGVNSLDSECGLTWSTFNILVTETLLRRNR